MYCIRFSRTKLIYINLVELINVYYVEPGQFETYDKMDLEYGDNKCTTNRTFDNSLKD